MNNKSEVSPFLLELARQLAVDYGARLGQVTVVFPNRRAGLFFRKYLSQQIEKPIWSPEILSIEEFFDRLSPLQVADHLSQVFALFQAFRDAKQAQESFDKFFYWGEVLLRDFDEVDKYLVNPDDLFYLLKAQKEIESKYDYLTDEQREVIGRFWKNYGNQEGGERSFSTIWEALAGIYRRFGDLLAEEGLTYEGRQHRWVAEAAKEETLSSSFESVVFAGFNALTLAEETVLKYFVTQFGARVVWDLDAYYVEDPLQEAGEFLRKYKEDRVLGRFFPDNLPNQLAQTPDTVEFVGVPLAVGQAKALGNELEVWSNQPGFDPERAVVVLPDENLLFPLLHSLPESISSYNVTMGYPLRQTLLYSFLEHVLALQQGKRGAKEQTQYSYRPLLALLRHPFLQHYNPELAQFWARQIEGTNRLWVLAEELKHSKKPLGNQAFYEVLFNPLQQENQVFDYLLTLLRYVRNHLPTQREEGGGIVEQEYLYQFYVQINRLQDITQQQTLDLSLDTLLRLFRTLIRNMRIPFSGEPLNGLQIMGVLETRNLDFDHVFMLSMNEETFPAAPNRSSFIPFNLRKGFGLPTFDQADAVSSYLFYRLLQRARHLQLYFNTEDTSQMKGEPSRYLLQIRYELGWKNLKERVLAHPMELSPVLPISVAKDHEVLARMERWRADLNPQLKGLTPSALSTYLACRLQFYFKYVASIKEPDEMEEMVNARLFGNILHNALEELYQDHWDLSGSSKVLPEHFVKLKQKVSGYIDRQFAAEFGQPDSEFHFEGRNVLVKEVIMQLVYQILKYDEAYAPFNLVGLEIGRDPEQDLFLEIELPQGGKVRLDGIIDRIDEKDGVIRVIDYKTGRDDKQVPSVESLFERTGKKRNKAAFQTFLYGLLYQEFAKPTNPNIAPGLYNAREMFSPDFQPHLILGKGSGKGVLKDFSTVASEFSAGLGQLIAELYDPSVPFDQTDDHALCSICAYRKICHR
ncbi:MAG TPA: PD-(D/E)XK nuclease family protein [Cytophagales bacterium]|nr:PD-(D/E)XK nuclease family protein [Cytophagales bacterium]HAA18016.1 PD-(D/E)XK nuclease family protein [Cytophagales bacterium]HAP63076.1 PD-(D/E)XK nuclease family protein [Cytophagales bacterium]